MHVLDVRGRFASGFTFRQKLPRPFQVWRGSSRECEGKGRPASGVGLTRSWWAGRQHAPSSPIPVREGASENAGTGQGLLSLTGSALEVRSTGIRQASRECRIFSRLPWFLAGEAEPVTGSGADAPELGRFRPSVEASDACVSGANLEGCFSGRMSGCISYFWRRFDRCCAEARDERGPEGGLACAKGLGLRRVRGMPARRATGRE